MQLSAGLDNLGNRLTSPVRKFRIIWILTRIWRPIMKTSWFNSKIKTICGVHTNGTIIKGTITEGTIIKDQNIGLTVLTQGIIRRNKKIRRVPGMMTVNAMYKISIKRTTTKVNISPIRASAKAERAIEGQFSANKTKSKRSIISQKNITANRNRKRRKKRLRSLKAKKQLLRSITKKRKELLKNLVKNEKQLLRIKVTRNDHHTSRILFFDKLRYI